MNDLDDRASTPELVRQLRDEVRLLLREERVLLRKEFDQRVGKVKAGAAYATGAALALYLGLLFLLIALAAALVVILDTVGVPLGQAVWIGPLITSLACSAVGGLLVHKLVGLGRQ